MTISSIDQTADSIIKLFLPRESNVPKSTFDYQLFRSSVMSLAGRLESLKDQHLSLPVVLEHRLLNSTERPLPPDYYQELNRYRRVGGAVGSLGGSRDETKQTTVQYLTEFINNFACNTYYIPNQILNHKKPNWDSLRSEFFEVANSLGQLVNMIDTELVVVHQYWGMWRNHPIFADGDMGRWFDFVFETAWKSIAELPILAPKKVYWNEWEVPVESLPTLETLVMSFSETTVRDLPTIPKPIASWYSEISDIVSASQHALNYLLSILPNGNEFGDICNGQPTGIQADTTFETLVKTVEDELDGISLRLFKFLINRKHKTDYDTLRDEIWSERKEITDNGIRSALERLSRRLNAMNPMIFEVKNEFSLRRVQINLLTETSTYSNHKTTVK